MKFSTLKPVLDLFKKGSEPLGPTEIAHRLNKSRIIVHKYLKELVEQGKLEKVGEGAHTKYRLTDTDIIADKNDTNSNQSDLVIPYELSEILDRKFLKFDSMGAIQKGTDGFLEWCAERDLDPSQKAVEFAEIYYYIEEQFDTCGVLNATQEFKKHVENMYLDQVYYADQYTWKQFGRGKLAELTFYGKQSQDYSLLMQSIDGIKRKLQCLIKRDAIDALAIVPWSIKRENQLLKVLQKNLESFGLPFLNIIKYYPNKIPVPQKSLKTRQERLKNARETIFIDDDRADQFRNILLIDDFVGSGSTLNETAGKLKKAGAKTVKGFAFVGNANLDYEVIREI